MSKEQCRQSQCKGPEAGGGSSSKEAAVAGGQRPGGDNQGVNSGRWEEPRCAGSGQGRSSGCREKGSKSGCIWKTEPIGFVDGKN